MSWEELTRLSDRELLLLLHQRVDQLEQKVESRWNTTWKALAWAVAALFGIMGLFISGHAARLW